MSRPVLVKFAVLVPLVALALTARGTAQDRSGTWMRVQQLHTSGSILTETATLARATQMQAQLDQASKSALVASAPVRSKVSPQQAAQLKAIGRDLARDPSSATAQSNWRSLIAAARPMPQDINALVQWVLRESYLQQTEDLRHYAEKMKYYNEVKSKLRGYLESARKGETASTTGVRILPHNSATSRSATTAVPNAKPAIVQPSTPLQVRTRDQIAKWEEQLNAIGDDAQLANVDLQNILQKQQQTLQMMSNISKMLHDTASAVIRKIGG